MPSTQHINIFDISIWQMGKQIFSLFPSSFNDNTNKEINDAFQQGWGTLI